MAGVMKVIDLGTLGDQGVEVDGFRAGQQNGTITAVGDVNGDGFADFNVVGGAFNKAHPHYDMVVFGAGDLAPSLTGAAADGRHAFTVENDSAAHAAGDINGDGVDDFRIGRTIVYGDPGREDPVVSLPTTTGDKGVVMPFFDEYLPLGDVNGDGFEDVLLHKFAYTWDYGDTVYNGHASVALGGPTGATPDMVELTSNDAFRFAVTTAALGDVNGDGFDDLMINLGDHSGTAYDYAGMIVFGHADFHDTNLEQGSGKGVILPNAVKAAGDVNGDGVDDVLNGKSIVFGQKADAAGWTWSQPDEIDGSNGFTLAGLSNPKPVIVPGGDVNGDGFEDLLVADYWDDAGGAGAGAVYVVFGRAHFHPRVDLSRLNDETGFKVIGGAVGDHVGQTAPVALGDVNGDGVDDFGIGARDADVATGVDAGAAYVVYGLLPDEAVVRRGGDGAEHLVGGNLEDRLLGFGGDDGLWGNGGADTLQGGAGADTLHGGAGADTLGGGAGDDLIEGGDGADRLSGGPGADTFLFRLVDDSPSGGADIIVGLGPGDLIDLSAIDADPASDGDQAFQLVRHFSGHAGELVLTYDRAARSTLVQADVDGDGAPDMVIQIQGHHTTFTGFVL